MLKAEEILIARGQRLNKIVLSSTTQYKRAPPMQIGHLLDLLIIFTSFRTSFKIYPLVLCSTFVLRISPPLPKTTIVWLLPITTSAPSISVIAKSTVGLRTLKV